MQQSEEFMSVVELVDMLHGHVHPVILSSEHYDEYYSHHGVGTAFVLELAGELFVVTAQHVLNNQGATHEQLRILLRKAPISILFDLCSVFREEADPDLDSDLVIFRVAKSQHAALFTAGLASLNADYYAQTRDLGRADALYVFGYPDEGREYDYDSKAVGCADALSEGTARSTKAKGPFDHQNCRGSPSGLTWYERLSCYCRC